MPHDVAKSEQRHADIVPVFEAFQQLTSMAVMREFEIQKILTEDGHFAQVGLGFELIR